MRKAIILLLLAACVLSQPATAQSGAIRVLCEQCRDPLKYPDDWANFAFNQIYGEEAWMNFDQADDFWIYNLEGDRVYVDVDYVMKGVNVLGNEVPLLPTNLLQITLALPNGDIIEVLRSVFVTPLPVPAPPGPNTGPGDTGGGGESGNDGVDDPEPGDQQDPDWDGEFPEPETCVEC